MERRSSCPDVQSLEQLLCGHAPTRAVEPLARHLETCTRCAAAVGRLKGADDLEGLLAADVLDDLPDEEPVQELIERLSSLPASAEGDAFTFVEPSGVGPGAEPDDTAFDADAVLAPPEAADELGRVGPYRVLEQLGAGGMGVVYRAEQARPRRVVALKMILAGPHAGGGRLARFRAEVEAVGRLQHPNIVAVFDAGEHEGRPYYTMEYVPGGSLAQRLAAGPLAPAEAARLVETLARAMAYAHVQGVVHRDLKPANVLMAVEGGGWRVAGERQSSSTLHPPPSTLHPKIADFGLAKQLDAPGETQSGMVLGTPSYMAPEQADGGIVGPAADVYALGAILYECLTGRPPFKAAGVLETLEQVRGREPVAPWRLQPSVPRDLETVCLKCLEKEPERRYPGAGDLADDLGRFLAGEPVRARPAGSVERLVKWSRRKPALAALVVVSVLGVATLVSGVLVHNARLREAAGIARHERERAELGYRAARDALRRMLARVGGKELADVPRLRELRRALAEDGLAFYEHLLEDLGEPAPAVRGDAALALVEAANLQMMLGRPDDARANYHKAAGLLEALREEAPADETYLAGLADCCNGLGNLAAPDGRRPWYTRALALRTELARRRPDDPDVQNNVAASHHNLAVAEQMAGRRAEAETGYGAALAIRRRLVRDHPNAGEYRAALAETLLNLGLIRAQTNRVALALADFEQAQRALEPFVQSHPDEVRWAMALAPVYGNWALVLKDVGRAAEAVERFGRMIALLDDVAQREPGLGRLQEFRVNAHGGRALAYAALGRHADAVADWDKVVAWTDGSAQREYRVFRAAALIRAGRPEPAIAEVAALTPGADGCLDYNLACVASLAGEYWSLHGQADRAEACARQAVGLLEKSQAAGFFRLPQGHTALRQDKDLDFLRPRADFRRLLE